MITEIEEYFTKGCGRCDRFATPECSVQQWRKGLNALRRLCLDAGLAETVKWGHPCYGIADRNVALIGAFRGDFRLTFMNAALMTDPDGVLERAGPNSPQPCLIRFTDAEGVARMAPVIRAYLEEAAAHARAGRRPPRETPRTDVPDELTQALDDDPELAEAFAALTPGRQRSHALFVGAAKKVETRHARIRKLRPKIMDGKGATER